MLLELNRLNLLLHALDGIPLFIDCFLADVHPEKFVLGFLAHTLELEALCFGGDSERSTNTPSTSSAADTVNVFGELCGKFEVDHSLDLFDVQSTGCEISCQQDILFAFLEIHKCLDPLCLT